MELNKENGFFLIPQFENYVIDVKQFKIINLTLNKEIRPISNMKAKKFKLSRNGQPHYLSLFEIMKSVIQKYY